MVGLETTFILKAESSRLVLTTICPERTRQHLHDFQLQTDFRLLSTGKDNNEAMKSNLTRVAKNCRKKCKKSKILKADT